MTRQHLTLALCVAGIFGCVDRSAPTAFDPLASEAVQGGAPFFDHFVAMGTSISMGNVSSGIVSISQQESWVAQLSRRAGHPMTLPLIASPGCPAPFATPLVNFKRSSGESITLPSDQLQCGSLMPDIFLPAQNVAISGATTGDALATTPQKKKDLYGQRLYALVLPPNTTQVGAMRMQQPTFVSVEFGANEVLGAQSGVAIPGATLVPFAVWAPQFHALVDTVAMFAKKGLVVGLVHDVGDFPGMRRGDEIWRDRATLLTVFNVAVNADCMNSVNLMAVNFKVTATVGAGLINKQNGLPPVPLSCADGGFGAVDYILTPSEASVVNGLMAQMNAEVINTAVQQGWAHFELEALYGRPNLKARYSAFEQMMSAHPYGALISNDGIHPSPAGYKILADAAAEALRATYRLNIPSSPAVAVK
ncbi:MAG: hypothetical protein U0132_02940 [Gemmatimonadaceae bacterium]